MTLSLSSASKAVSIGTIDVRWHRGAFESYAPLGYPRNDTQVPEEPGMPERRRGKRSRRLNRRTSSSPHTHLSAS